VSILAELPEAAAVAIIRLRSLGDCVLTTPAIHLLKQSRPDLRIGVVVEDRFRDVFTGNDDVTAILRPSLLAMRRFAPELVINLHGGTRSLTLAAGSGARHRAGFAHLRGKGIHNLLIPTAQEILGIERRVHTAEHLASVMFWLGADRAEIPRARLVVSEPSPVQGHYAVIHPVASMPDKTWPHEKFEAVAERLGIEPVFVAGAADDLSQFSRFRILTGMPLERTKALLSGAALFIGNDSGPAHMAAAFGIPVVVLFGPSDPTVWAPWRTAAEVLQAIPISDIAVDSVLEAGARLQEVVH
jgi:heptosyltransferase-3